MLTNVCLHRGIRDCILFLSLALVLSACSGSSIPVPSAAPASAPPDSSSLELQTVALPAGYGVRGSWLELYFTDPSSPLASQRTGGMDGPLVEAIDSARLTLDVAIYSLSLNSVRSALIRAHNRGVRVRMVMESDNMDRADPQAIKDAGIPILGDRREGLMHNKFVVIDGYEVWTGSANFTDSGVYDDNNFILCIRSMKLAENFTKEFEEMFVDDKFGDNTAAETPYPRLTIGGTEVETYFSPDDGVQARVVEIVNAAQESIYFMAFSFTSDPIGQAIRARAEDGVTVAGVMDNEQVKSNVGTEYDPFRHAGLDVYRDGNAGQMHHKVIVVDERIVILGSYNFTHSAEVRNDETLLVIHSAEIAAQFIEEFKRVYAQAD